MSFLKSKFSGWLSDGTRTPFMGGGGSPGPSQNTTVTTNIPEYAKPYVTNMFEATQRQLFTGNKTPEGGFDITGFTGYTPYSTDVNNYYAGFSPLQKQAQMDAGAMQQPGQFALGSGLAGSAGIRSLGAAGQFGQNVTNQQRVDATGKPMFDPITNQPLFDASNTTQSFMSPYQQNVTDFAKQAAVREAQMAQQAQNLGAARTGTYGGARQTLSNMERERNLLSNLSNIQTQGSQSAYDRAMQTQQFGANLGMQGYGQALGAGAQLGQLGATQQATDIARQNQMAGMGQQQQALEQNKINQAIQDYATQQQYPLMQLGFMSNMLRGLPMQATNTQSYQAQPSTLQQGIGLVGAAGTLLGGKAEGGVIKMAEGGITGYKYGGAIPEPKLESMADNLSVAQLQQRIKDPALTPGERQVFQEALAAKQQTAARSSGIAAAGGGLFNTMGYAGGGILAFAGEDGSLVQDPQFGGGANLDEDQARLDAIKLQKDIQQYNFLKDASPVAAQRLLEQNPMLRDKVAPAAAPAVAAAPKPETAPAPAPAPRASGNVPTGPSAAPATAKGLEAYMADQERIMGPNTVGQGLEAKIAERLAGMSDRASQDERAAMRQAFVRLGTEASPGGFLQAATKSVGTYGDARDAAAKVRENMDLELTKMQADIKKGERAEKRGNLDAASKSFENAENRQLKIAEMQNQLKVAGIQASGANAANNLKREEKAAIKADLTKTLGREPTMAEILNAYTKATSVADESADARLRVAANTAYQKWEAGIVLDPMFRELQKKASKGDEAAAAKIEELKAAKRKQITAEIMGTQQTSSSGGAKGQVDTKNPLLGP
jgi:hypothetical protein